MGLGTAFTAEVVDLDQPAGPSIDSTVVKAEVWHNRRGHPSEQVMRGVQKIPESG